jgi:hypothetical protein
MRSDDKVDVRTAWSGEGSDTLNDRPEIVWL